jgi:hypothetical protein
MNPILNEPLLDELANSLSDRSSTRTKHARDMNLAECLPLAEATVDNRFTQGALHVLGGRETRELGEEFAALRA